VDYKDLLGRVPVRLEVANIADCLRTRRILVTGCGGSIGSELCRHIVKFQPGRLILWDASEPNLYQIQMELQHEWKFQNYVPILGQIQQPGLLDRVFRQYQPEVVFHAAAYKHVPLLEQNPWDAVSNNIGASELLMKTSADYSVDRFVLVSTDKAVRPTNIMGASKRVTELILQSMNGSKTRFMAVRFGNVLGSAGSVIPLFQRQIERGGPVTVTHPEVTRYFMTIPEAAQLILQAGSMGSGGELFILNMGTPVRILDMARDLIRLSGKDPERDIPIVFTGLRPGEKLYEELITEGEGIVTTHHEKIRVIKSSADSVVKAARVLQHLAELYHAADRHDALQIRDWLKTLVPEYASERIASVLTPL
jgi:FlaA1/EpsC-like NDP-sugar epimerase